MKLILTSLLLTIFLTTNAQKWTTEKIIVTSIGASTTMYGFLRVDKSYEMHKQSVGICMSGILFAGIYLALDNKLPDNIEINSSGINFKLKYKQFKCKYNPLKK